MRVLLVEDEPDLGAAIRQVLSRHKYVVDWVQDGTEAWNYLNSPELPYTLLILDWMLPGLSGVELCRRLRSPQAEGISSQSHALPILMLTARDSMADKVAGLDAGADDYLVKPFGMEELLARLRALLRRSQHLQPPQLRLGPLCLDYGSSTVVVETGAEAQTPIFLTAKEFQLLEYFMQHPNQILTQEQIRNRLWDLQSESVSNVVAAQVRLLRRKLGEYGCDQLIETLRGLGYRFNVPHASKSTV